ncbi:MAG TPA: di-heme oxidoredictase family protein, partial [Candidatus Binataceae bacterium]|nr:di-heme oxidoredictase family protein [Candidatus Binataceae bacterium]
HLFAADNILRAGAQQQGASTVFAGGMMAMPLGCQISDPNCNLSPCQKAELAATTFSPDLPMCDPTSAAFAAGGNCTGERQSTPLFGLGLVEAVPDSTFVALAASEPEATRGAVKMLQELGSNRAARFGWKDDAATLRGFVVQATTNELGLTTPDNPVEVSTCAMGETQFGITLEDTASPEDTPDATGRAKFDRMVDFIRALSPPPRLPEDASARQGGKLFTGIGCASCHEESLRTASNPAAFIPSTTGGVAITASVNRALANKEIHPFSDFLLHDMGALGDGITSGSAGPTMMRTAPLWGMRAKVRFLHDGRAEDVATAIKLHDGQAAAAAAAFGRLTSGQQQEILDFLDTI